uniref:KA1 domain-containing protein n=1 Tax=Ditylum brightwellii TaxID=49249 RepID=A0A6V2ABW7_9STRA
MAPPTSPTTMSKDERMNDEGVAGAVFRSVLLQPGQQQRDPMARHNSLNLPTYFPNENAMGYKNIPCPSSAKTRSSNATTKTAKCVDETATSWVIMGDIHSLPNAATIFPLEKTRVTLTGISPNEVAKRICDSLRDLSIQIILTKKNKLLAESIDIRFYIKLYRVENTKLDGASGDYQIMVELQKRRGDSLSFKNVARTILKAAKNGNNVASCKNNGTPRLPPLFYDENKETVVEAKHDFFTDLEKKGNLSFTDTTFSSCDIKYNADLLMGERMDGCLLGMQDLALLTNADSTNHATALFVARLILQNDNGGDKRDWPFGLDEFIQKFITFDNLYNENGNDWDGDNDNTESWYHRKIRYYALTVLSNSLNIVADGSSEEEGCCITTDVGMALIPVLIRELNDAKKRPHDAHQAMRCINVLLGISPPEVLTKAMELGFPSSIQSSLDVGRCCHSLLAKESEVAMTMECAL